MIDWLSSNQNLLAWLSALSVLTFVISLIALPWIAGMIPKNYFANNKNSQLPFKKNHSYFMLVTKIGKNILGYEIDVNPYGTMLFMKNKDVPGVIGNVGTTLGKSNINIGGYLLSREMKEGEAFSVVRVDHIVSDEVLEELCSLPQIISVQQLHC